MEPGQDEPTRAGAFRMAHLIVNTAAVDGCGGR